MRGEKNFPVVAIIAFAINFGCYVAIILNRGIEIVAVGKIFASSAHDNRNAVWNERNGGVSSL